METPDEPKEVSTVVTTTKLERINVDTVAVGDYVQGVKSRLLYRVISVKVNEVTIQRVDDPENVQTLIKLALYNKFRVAEAPVAVEPVKETVETEPKQNKKTKITNEQYLAIAEVLLKEQYKTKKELAKKYGVDTAIISDILNPKYCRKSCREAVEELKIKYEYTR